MSQQDEKSQIKNRAKAMKVLRSRLYEMEMQKQQDAIAKDRRSQVGTGERSEKIRTYNFPENRVTDHRIGFTMHQLDAALDGDLGELIDAAVTHFTSEKLKDATEADDRGLMTLASTRVAQARAQAHRGAPASGRDDAALDAEVLARHVLGWDRADCSSAGATSQPADFAERFARSSTGACRREPVAYILGEREFWGREFEVTRDVLIPRPETELIVEEALELFPPGARRRVIVDVGTGSGCLAVALALEFPQPRVIATDISAAALDVARGTRHGTASPTASTFVQRRSPRAASPRPLDLIVSNPPTSPERDAGLVPEVRELRAARRAVRRHGRALRVSAAVSVAADRRALAPAAG